MALQKCGLNINQASRGFSPTEPWIFHVQVMHPGIQTGRRMRFSGTGTMNWKSCLLKRGGLRVRVPQMSFELKKGDCLAINSNVLHYAIAAPFCELHSIVFAPGLITGNNETVYAKNIWVHCNPALPFKAIYGRRTVVWRSCFAALFKHCHRKTPVMSL